MKNYRLFKFCWVIISRIILIFDLTNYRHAATKSYVESASDEISLLRNIKSKFFINFLYIISLLRLNAEPNSNNHTIIESHLDSLSKNNGNWHDLSLVFNDQDNEFDDIKVTNVDSCTVNREPSRENELSLQIMLMTH